MNIKKYMFSVALMGLCLLASCYDDKGNYDYDTLNDIGIVVKTEASHYVLGDVLKITPELTFTLGKEDSELVYKWTFNESEISHERNLNWTVDRIGDTKSLQLEVLDKRTGITYFGLTTISITSPYVAEGWLVLSEKDNKSMLTYVRKNYEEDTMKCVTTRDIYNLINKESLGSQPTFMSVHFVNRWDSEDTTGWVWITQKGGQGSVDLSGSSYKRQASLENLFLAGSYPDKFIPKMVVDFRFLSLAVGEDGTIYTRVKENDLLFNSGYFLGDRPLTFSKKKEDGTTQTTKVDGGHLVIAPFAEHGGILVYDKNTSSYLHLCDHRDSYKSWQTGALIVNAMYSGKVLPLSVEEKKYKNMPEFSRLDNMAGNTVHYTGAYQTNDYGNMGYMSVLEKDGAFYLQNFKVSDFDIYAPDAIGAEPVSQEDIPSLGNYVNGSSKNCFALCRFQKNAPYLFVSSGNNLYMSYLKGESLAPVPFALFDAPIASIDVENSNNRYLSVGLENGDFYVISLDKDVIEEILKTGAIRPTVADNKKTMWVEKDLGKIIQVLYKNPANTGNWMWDLD